jgi:hypothetical protein
MSIEYLTVNASYLLSNTTLANLLLNTSFGKTISQTDLNKEYIDEFSKYATECKPNPNVSNDKNSKVNYKIFIKTLLLNIYNINKTITDDVLFHHLQFFP